MLSITSLAAPLLSVLLLSTKTLAANVTLDYATFAGTESYTNDVGTTLPDALNAYPQAPLKANGTVSATAYGPTCLQSGTGEMSEDCLSLNVFAPKGTTKSSKLPVAIWSMSVLLFLFLLCSPVATQYMGDLSILALGVDSLPPWFQIPLRRYWEYRSIIVCVELRLHRSLTALTPLYESLDWRTWFLAL
jgi:hypothetical protein